MTTYFNYLYFRDTGPGIPEYKLESIFESFMTSGKAEGTGLGLPFCRRVVTVFDGKIVCNSKLGEYTEFTIFFPKLSKEDEERKEELIVKKDIIDMTTKLALELNVIGLINLQFAVKDNEVYVLEVNPRSSRTVPFVSKYSNVPLANIAAQLSVGRKISDFNLNENRFKHTAVKKAVLPFKKFKDEKVFLGPEMKSTGEVMGIDTEPGIAFLKAMQSDGYTVPRSGTAFVSITDVDKKRALPIIKDLEKLNFTIIATKGTAEFLLENNINCSPVFKVGEGRPNVVDEILNDNIHLVINTPQGAQSRYDEEAIGKTSVMKNVLTITTLAGAKAAIEAMSNMNKIRVAPLQEYFKQ